MAAAGASVAPLIWGIDLAGSCGLAEGRIGTSPRLSTIRFDSSSDETTVAGIIEKAGRATRWFAKRLKDGETPDVVYIEAPIPERALGSNTNAHSTAVKFMLLGAVTGTLRAKRIVIKTANIQRVRKHFIGRGNLKNVEAKPQVMSRCRSMGWDPQNFDESDAAAVWDFGCGQENAAGLFGRIKPLPKAELPLEAPRSAASAARRAADALFNPDAVRRAASGGSTVRPPRTRDDDLEEIPI